jgi:hypothetical protein
MVDIEGCSVSRKVPMLPLKKAYLEDKK